MNLKLDFSISEKKKKPDILTGIVLNMWIALCDIDILTVLHFPIHEHGMSSHLFVSLIYFSSVLYFLVYKSFASLA